MIMSHETELLKSRRQLRKLWRLVDRAERDGWRIDQLERQMFTALLALGLTLLVAFVRRQGTGDAGSTLTLGGRRLRRSRGRHARRYVSIFGALSIRRYVYAWQERQKVESAPLDGKLGLPAGEFSYVLADWQQRLCVKESFREATTSLAELLGTGPGVRSAEYMNQHVAQDAEGFRGAQPLPPPQDEEALLVVTADGKGVPMRRPVGERVRTAPRRGKGEKANKKQMAYVGAVYTIAPFRRSVEDVVREVRRRRRKRRRPQPRHKHLWAEMTRTQHGQPCSGKERLFVQMALECLARDPQRRKRLVCLMDGEPGLWEVQREWLPRSVGILDLFHVLERLWAVAHCVHAEKSPQAAAFVTGKLRLLLQGKVGYVIGSLRRLRDRHELRGERRRTLDAAIRYYHNNRQHMRYDEYLAAGDPIGSGVAEGACRHLVKDRMEGTGMRWTVAGAQAMLHLRAIHLNGDWDNFQQYHVQHEQAALYGKAAA